MFIIQRQTFVVISATRITVLSHPWVWCCYLRGASGCIKVSTFISLLYFYPTFRRLACVQLRLNLGRARHLEIHNYRWFIGKKTCVYSERVHFLSNLTLPGVGQHHLVSVCLQVVKYRCRLPKALLLTHGNVKFHFCENIW